VGVTDKHRHRIVAGVNIQARLSHFSTFLYLVQQRYFLALTNQSVLRQMNLRDSLILEQLYRPEEKLAITLRQLNRKFGSLPSAIAYYRTCQ
jgi:hypothetical protein